MKSYKICTSEILGYYYDSMLGTFSICVTRYLVGPCRDLLATNSNFRHSLSMILLYFFVQTACFVYWLMVVAFVAIGDGIRPSVLDILESSYRGTLLTYGSVSVILDLSVYLCTSASAMWFLNLVTRVLWSIAWDVYGEMSETVALLLGRCDFRAASDDNGGALSPRSCVPKHRRKFAPVCAPVVLGITVLGVTLVYPEPKWWWFVPAVVLLLQWTILIQESLSSKKANDFRSTPTSVSFMERLKLAVALLVLGLLGVLVLCEFPVVLAGLCALLAFAFAYPGKRSVAEGSLTSEKSSECSSEAESGSEIQVQQKLTSGPMQKTVGSSSAFQTSASLSSSSSEKARSFSAVPGSGECKAVLCVVGVPVLVKALVQGQMMKCAVYFSVAYPLLVSLVIGACYVVNCVGTRLAGLVYLGCAVLLSIGAPCTSSGDIGSGGTQNGLVGSPSGQVGSPTTFASTSLISLDFSLSSLGGLASSLVPALPLAAYFIYVWPRIPFVKRRRLGTSTLMSSKSATSLRKVAERYKKETIKTVEGGMKTVGGGKVNFNSAEDSGSKSAGLERDASPRYVPSSSSPDLPPVPSGSAVRTLWVLYRKIFVWITSVLVTILFLSSLLGTVQQSRRLYPSESLTTARFPDSESLTSHADTSYDQTRSSMSEAIGSDLDDPIVLEHNHIVIDLTLRKRSISSVGKSRQSKKPSTRDSGATTDSKISSSRGVSLHRGTYSNPSLQSSSSGEYAICETFVYGVDIVSLAIVAMASYSDAETSLKILKSVLPFEVRLVDSKSGSGLSHTYWTEFYLPESDVTIIGIRGTEYWRITDYLELIRMWTESVGLSLLGTMLPTTKSFPEDVLKDLVQVSHKVLAKLRIARSESHSGFKYRTLLKYLREVDDSNSNSSSSSNINISEASSSGERKVILTGHSLGGSIATLLSTLTGHWSVGFMPPGLQLTLAKLEEATSPTRSSATGGRDSDRGLHDPQTNHGGLHHHHQRSISVLVEEDMVASMVDGHTGLTQKVACDFSTNRWLACHLIEGTICHLMRHCPNLRWSEEFQCSVQLSPAQDIVNNLSRKILSD